jgi:hypothetical protein
MKRVKVNIAMTTFFTMAVSAFAMVNKILHTTLSSRAGQQTEVGQIIEPRRSDLYAATEKGVSNEVSPIAKSAANYSCVDPQGLICQPVLTNQPNGLVGGSFAHQPILLSAMAAHAA